MLQLRRLTSGELLRELLLPGLGSVGGFSGDRKGTDFFFSYTSKGAVGCYMDSVYKDRASHGTYTRRQSRCLAILCTHLLFFLSGFVEPGSTYRVDVADAEPEPTLFRRTKLSVEHNPEDYVTKQVRARCASGRYSDSQIIMSFAPTSSSLLQKITKNV